MGLATGLQDKFSWKGVGLAALGGAIGGGLGKGGLFKNGAFSNVGKSAALQAGLRGATASVLSQGIATTTGLQSKFNFAGVAAAGVGAAAGSALGSRLGGNPDSFGNRLATHTAPGIANAATRSAIEGSSFSRNLVAAIPDVIGQAVGGAIGREIYDPAVAAHKAMGGGNQSISNGRDRQLASDIGIEESDLDKFLDLLASARKGGIERFHMGGDDAALLEFAIDQRVKISAARSSYEEAGGTYLKKFLEFEATVDAAYASIAAYGSDRLNELMPNHIQVDSTTLKKYRLDNLVLNDETSGYAAILFKPRAGEGPWIYANRGTEVQKPNDVGTDVANYGGFTTGQYEHAVLNASQVQFSQLFFDLPEVLFTGHSLGGGLAAAQALAIDARAITFNAANVASGVLGRVGIDARNHKQLITNYVVVGDPVSGFLDGTEVPALGARVSLPFTRTGLGNRHAIATIPTSLAMKFNYDMYNSYNAASRMREQHVGQ